jgi:hypothetical protein
MYEGALPGADPTGVAAFWKEVERFNKSMTAVSKALDKAIERVGLMRHALQRTQTAPGDLDRELYRIKQQLLVLDEKLNGNRSKAEIGEKNVPTIRNRYAVAAAGTNNSTYGPTPTHKRSLEIGGEQMNALKTELEKIIIEDIPKAEKALMEIGAPWIEGQPIPEY